MASLELQRLWKLHLVDAAIVEIRARAAHFDAGQTISKEIESIQKEEVAVGGSARALHAEQKDLELANKTIEDKLKKVDRDLYGGKVVNPREVEAYEKEITYLKKQRDTNDERLLELMDLLPPAQADAAKVQKRLDDAKARLEARRKAAAVEKAEIEKEYARLNQVRPGMTQNINPGLLAKYEDIRKKHAGTGMSEVNRRSMSCSACGTLLPERALQGLKDDKVVTCESCRRILYFSEGAI